VNQHEGETGGVAEPLPYPPILDKRQVIDDVADPFARVSMDGLYIYIIYYPI
jgi:hypothetical protein